ncbi:MAG TPA: BTAD domain-containing putative transcriptional regulator [Pseudonocardiaceae bacterium]
MQVRVLGPFEVMRGGEVVTPSAPKLRSVLALFAVHANSVVRTDQIIEELWEDRPPFSATTTLQTYVYQLRKLLGWPARQGRTAPQAEGQAQSVTLRTTPGGYLLELEPDALDAHRFERMSSEGWAKLEAGDLESASAILRKALQLWRGPALTAVDTGPVLQAEAVRLEEKRKVVTEWRIDADLQLGRHPELIGELTGLVAQQPTHEGFQGKLMLALYRAGRRSEALQVYQRARAALARELGLEPSAELQRLHRAVLAADPALDAPISGVGMVRVGKRVEPPSQLPPDVPRLVGRTRQVELVRRVLAPGQRTTPPVVQVVGAPGSGKTAFCVHAAHQVRAVYPDGQLYARMEGAEGTPLTAAEVLADFLRAVGVPRERMPATVEERSRMFRSWTATRKVLVVLDDVSSVEQLLPLLPSGPGCATLVATRRRLADAAITVTVSLPRLGTADAVQLLSDVVGSQRAARDAAAIRELADMCDGLPMALRGAASRVQLRPHWPITRLLPRMRGEERRAPASPVGELGIGASVLASYRLVSPAGQAAFRQVASRVSDPVSAAEAAVMLGVDELTAEALLEELVEFQLAEVVDAGPGGPGGDGFRYWFRPLFQAVAGQLVPAGEETEATRQPAATVPLRVAPEMWIPRVAPA